MSKENQRLMIINNNQSVALLDDRAENTDRTIINAGLSEIKSLIKIANSLDEKGLYKEADIVDEVILSIAQQGGYAQRFQEGVERTGRNITQGVQNFVGNVGTSLTGMAGQIAATLGGGVDSVVAAWEAAGNKIEDLKKLIDQWGNDAVEAVMKMWQKVTEAGAAAATLMKDFIYSMIVFAALPFVLLAMGLAEAGTIFMAIFNQVKTSGANLVSAALEKIQQAVTAGWKQWDKFKDVLAGVVGGTLQWVNNQWKAVQAGVGAYQGSLAGSSSGSGSGAAAYAARGTMLDIGDPSYLYVLTPDARGYIAYQKSNRSPRLGTDGKPRVFTDAAGLAKVKAGKPA